MVVPVSIPVSVVIIPVTVPIVAAILLPLLPVVLRGTAEVRPKGNVWVVGTAEGRPQSETQEAMAEGPY